MEKIIKTEKKFSAETNSPVAKVLVIVISVVVIAVIVGLVLYFNK